MAVLMAYATRQGAVRGVAERVAELLRDQDLEVDLRRLTGYESLADYDAVVFGSAIYSRAWLDEAVNFAGRNAARLAARPLWTFSVGRLCDVGAAHPPHGVGAPDHRFFVVSTFEREVFRRAGGRCGGFRDWPEIDIWAYGIAEQVSATRRVIASSHSGG
jgi:menaquinone-dependent protoporphyrinogen oxidase